MCTGRIEIFISVNIFDSTATVTQQLPCYLPGNHFYFVWFGKGFHQDHSAQQAENIMNNLCSEESVFVFGHLCVISAMYVL